MKNNEKHPLFVRWTHWINFPLMSLMVWSGAMIYWANRTYWPKLPEFFFNDLGLAHKLSIGLSYHFFLMWLFGINGILYFFYVILSGEWRELIPVKNSFKEALQVVLHDLGLRPLPPQEGRFNAAQRIVYSGVIVMGFIFLLSGIAIYKPIQLNWLKNLLGGYEVARRIHFYLTLSIVLFFFVHIAQVIKAGWKNFKLMGPVVAVLSLSLIASGFIWIIKQAPVNEVPGPLRKVFAFNEAVTLKFYNPNKIDRGSFQSPALGQAARVNGDLGLDDDNIDIKNWKISIFTPLNPKVPGEMSISLDDLKKLPKTDYVNQFKCIEGWSETVSFSGLKFVDFLNHYHLGTHSGNPIDLENHPEDLYSYVGLQTPDGDYYVSVDMRSMLGSQTLLAYEMNGEPLTLAHGAPLRLAIPTKYGVKNLKRIGQIRFADNKLPDYWGEQGYDWFIGL